MLDPGGDRSNAIGWRVVKVNELIAFGLARSSDDVGALNYFGLGVDLGEVETLIFADGFESGDTSAWSATVE